MRAVLFIILMIISASYQPLQSQTLSPTPFYPALEWDTSPYQSYRFTQKDAKHGHEDWINFRILFPNNFDQVNNGQKKYPLILSLHGTGESARMDWDDTTKTKIPLSLNDPLFDNNEHQLLHSGQHLLEAVKSNRFPGFVVVPQNFYGSWTTADGAPQTKMHHDLKKAIELVEYLIQNFPVDPNRVYIHGMSNGGVATWYAAYHRPDLFAAVLPMSASGFPEMANRLTSMPLWVFQGGMDDNPRPSAAEETVQAIKAAGGKIRYTLYPDAGHNSWDSAFAEPDFFEWILSQKKGDELSSKEENKEEEEEEDNGNSENKDKEEVEDEEVLEEKEMEVEKKVEEEQLPNKLPTVSAGKDTTILLPQDSVYLKGSTTDEDGEIMKWEWEKIKGPDAFILHPDSLHTAITGLEEGTYTFRLYATDDEGATAFDEFTLTVKAQPLAVNNTKKNSYRIVPYPNPFTSILHLEISSPKTRSLRVRLFNPLGKLVYQGALEVIQSENQIFTLDFAGKYLPVGLYIIQLQDQEGHSVKTFNLLKE